MFGRGKQPIPKIDFAIIGAQKSGTTALHYFLSHHPHITMGDQQEIHFFDDEKVFAVRPDYELLHRHYRAGPDQIAGDCTPSYLFWEPVPARLREYNPEIKLIALLRNPVDRAFAHWNMQSHKEREPFDFLEALRLEKERTAVPLSVESRRFSYVARGFYAQQLERYFNSFPRTQMHIIKFDDFRNERDEVLQGVADFLGMQPFGSLRDSERNVVPYEREMTPAERTYLLGLFAEDITRLEKLLGWDCSDWKSSSSSKR